MTLKEIEKSLRNAILQLGNRATKGSNDFDNRVKKQQLRDLIDDLKRRRKEALENEKDCPRCLRKELLMALSRRDNKTSICSRCGQEEALIDAEMIDDKFLLGVDKIFKEKLKRE